MATVNIRRDVADPFYRYKMEKLQSKIEGKGNGIKTVIVNLSSVSQSLARPPAYVIKYFGFELGAQTTLNPSDDRWIINGAHEAAKLQDYLDGFISKFVLCKKCKNPETDVHVKDGGITLDCKACGKRSDVDLRLKLSGYIIKDQPKKGKKDKSTKKADRKARKEAERNEGNGESPGESNNNSDNGDDGGDVELEAGSDDELTRRINAEAEKINGVEEEKEVQWATDLSKEAQEARLNSLPTEMKGVSLNDEDEDGESNAYEQLGTWVLDTAAEKGGVDKVSNVDIYIKAKELGIESKHRTLTVLAQSIFDDNFVKQIDGRASMLAKMITSERHAKAFLGGTERFVGITKPNLIPQVSAILIKYYENDLVSEEILQAWGTKASKKYVDISTSKKVRKSAETFLKWLETAESDESEEEEEEEEDE